MVGRKGFKDPALHPIHQPRPHVLPGESGACKPLQGLTEAQLVGRSKFGEAWIRAHHEVGGPGISPTSAQWC